jgi:Cysteine-rich secretory protein family
VSRALVFVLVLCALFPATAAAGCVRADAIPSRDTLAEAEAATLCLVNAERRSRGLAALRFNTDLAQAAAGHSRDMVRRRYFGHTSPGGRGSKARARAAGYPSSSVVENIAWGAWKYATPRRIVALWMRSGIHRAATARAGRAWRTGFPSGAARCRSTPRRPAARRTPSCSARGDIRPSARKRGRRSG